jgi:glucose-6-phosphate isomerase/transaldolase/glucose-6-phosphate isomerase
VFENDPDIGGRYSVLSYFGLVPAALAGVNVEAMLHARQVAEQNCAQFDDTAVELGLWLGCVMGELPLRPRQADVRRVRADRELRALGRAADRRVDRQAGQGHPARGGEPLGDPEVYGDDRVFAYLREPRTTRRGLDARSRRSAAPGHPTAPSVQRRRRDLGRIFFFAEFATAVAGWALGINPFDQPNVQEAKDNTARILEEGLPDEDPGSLDDAAGAGRAAALRGDLGFVTPSEEYDAAVASCARASASARRRRPRSATGPRYLHSTGPVPQGRPADGLFIQLSRAATEDVEIPEPGYSFRAPEERAGARRPCRRCATHGWTSCASR